jgi:hypothetical protein
MGLSVTPDTRFHGEHANKVITQHGYLAGLTWARTKNMDLLPCCSCLGQLAPTTHLTLFNYKTIDTNKLWYLERKQ